MHPPTTTRTGFVLFFQYESAFENEISYTVVVELVAAPARVFVYAFGLMGFLLACLAPPPPLSLLSDGKWGKIWKGRRREGKKHRGMELGVKNRNGEES